MTTAFALSTPLLFRRRHPQHAAKAKVSYRSKPRASIDADLTAWAISCGATPHNVRIGRNEHGQALIATGTIASTDDIITLPEDVLLIADTEPNAPPPHFLQLTLKGRSAADFWTHAPWEVRLGLLLLDHVHQGAASKWATYVNALPQRPASVLLALTDSARAIRARQQLHDLDLLTDADNYTGHIVVQHATLRCVVAPDDVPLADFVRCVALAQSRAFGLPNPLGGKPTRFAMLPFLDAANHSCRSRSELRAVDVDDGVGVAYAIGGVDAIEGQEVHLRYGTHGIAQLALFYGFVEGGSPYASLEVGAEVVWDVLLRDEQQLQTHKQNALDTLDLAHDDDSFTVDMNEIDPRLMMALRIAVADVDELNVLQSMNLDAVAPHAFRPLGLTNEIRAWHCLMQHLEAKRADVGALEDSFRQKMMADAPFSEVCDWGGDNDAAAALIRFERNRVIDATLKRTRQFAEMSEKLGRLIDPAVLRKAAPSILRTPAPAPR